MPDPLLLTLPYGPSVNDYWRPSPHGGMYLTAEAKEYKRLVSDALRRGGVLPYSDDVGVKLAIYRPQDSGDLDNRFKCTFDVLAGFAYHNDKQISELTAKRFVDRKNPRIELEIFPLEPNTSLFRESAERNAYRRAAEAVVSAMNAIDGGHGLAAKAHLDKALEALTYFPGVLRPVVQVQPKPPAPELPRPAVQEPRRPHPRTV